jgi:hypothetical protein
MPNTIKIKRRNTGAAGAPGTMQSGELAFNDTDNTLYIGKGDSGGVATSKPAIGGIGAFVALAETQTITGNKTFSGTVSLGSSATATTPATSSNDTTVATTAFVKSLGLGSGSVTSVGLSLPGIFTVSGSPVTGAGTLSATLNNQAQNSVFAGPSSGGTGAVSFRALAAADIPTLTASKISDFNSTVQLNKLNQLGAPDGEVSMNLQKLTSLATPTALTDAATKGYVDSTAQGLDVKASCRVATTANITLSGTQTIDGISVVAGNRVLVKNQTTASQNGIYVVAASTWSRSDDANNGTKLHGGAFTFVEEGTTNADSGWVMTTDGTITIDTTAINWSQFSGAGQIDAGNGLTKTGNTLNVGTASTARIVVNSDNIDLATVTTTTPTGSAATSFVSGVTVDSYGRVTTVTTSPVVSASTSAAGIVQLSDSTSTTSSTQAATLTAVKAAKDVADGALSRSSGGTMTGKLQFKASDTTSAPINIPQGTADPASPVTGDLWNNGANLFLRTASKNNQVLWNDLANLDGQVAVAKGGTGVTSLTNNALVKGQGANPVVAATAGTDYVVGGTTTVGKIITAAATTSAAGLLLTAGTAPTTPTSGDIWNTGTAIQFRDTSTTKTIAFTDSNITGTASGLSATLAVGSGGTGATTLTGYVKGNGTSAMTAAATIPNTDITGLGTMSTQAASNVAITGGTIDGIVLDGGTY